MLSQSQNNTVVNLQKQTTYGLSTRSAQTSTKDGSKTASRSKAGKKGKENPLIAQENDKSTSKSRSKDRSAFKGRTARAQIASRNNTDKSLSPMKTISPMNAGRRRTTNPTKSPIATSIASSGKKTPCISALVRHQTKDVSEDYHQPSAQRSPSQYDKDGSLIQEEEHDSSSFLAAERQAQQAAAVEGSASLGDSRSQLS